MSGRSGAVAPDNDDAAARSHQGERRRRSKTHVELDVRLRALAADARLLPALTADNAGAERGRLVAALERGAHVKPQWRFRPLPALRDARVRVDSLRRVAEALPGGDLYCRRLDELELDLAILDARGQAKLVRSIAARRFGTGREAARGA